MEDENERQQIPDRLVEFSHLQLIPGSSPPEFIRQCDQWQSIVSFEQGILSRIDPPGFSRWDDPEDIFDGLFIRYVVAEITRLSVEFSRQPNVLSDVVMDALSITQSEIETIIAGSNIPAEMIARKFDEFRTTCAANWRCVPEPLPQETVESTKKRLISNPSEPRFADLLLHRELSTGGNWPWRKKKDAMWCSPCPLSYLRSGMEWDPIHRSVMYPNIRHTHMIERAFGKGECFALNYSASGKTLCAAYENGGIDVIHGQSESLHHIKSAHETCANTLCWMEEHTFASGGDDGQVALWDTRCLSKPTQALALARFDSVMDTMEQQTEKDLDRYIKDLSYQPATEKHGGLLVASTFSRDLHVIRIAGGLMSEPVKRRLSPNYNSRMLMIPEEMRFGGTVLLAFHDMGSPIRLAAIPTIAATGCSFLTSGFPPRLPSGWQSSDPVNLHHCHSSTQPYRSLTLDPLGGGVVVGTSRTSPYGPQSSLISAVTYHRFCPIPDTWPDHGVLGAIAPKFIHSQKASTEVLQQPAFPLNGCFLAAPQDRRVDILTSGGSAMPFSAYDGDVTAFTLSTVIKLPKCGDILCCAVSPLDNVTVAAGCTMGHVHFAQPNF